MRNIQAVAFGIRTLGLGGAAANAGSNTARSESASAPAFDSGSASLSTKLLPLQPTVTFPFNPQDTNTPITGIAPLPGSHYACVSAASGQIRMCVRSVTGTFDKIPLCGIHDTSQVSSHTPFNSCHHLH
jgi:hypothetical protein